MKGSLIQNTLIVAVIIILYYASVLLILYLFSMFDSVPIFDTWRTEWDSTTYAFWMFFIFFVVPLSIFIGFVVHTKPSPEIIYMR